MLCLNEHVARRDLGDNLASKLKARLADFSAVSFVSDLFALPGKPKELRQDQMMIGLVETKILVFESGHRPQRRLVTGRIDWAQVRRIQLLGIEDDS